MTMRQDEMPSPGLIPNGPRLCQEVAKAINYTGHIRNFEDVVAAIRAGREPSVSGREARRAVALIEALYRSAREGGARVVPG